MFSNSPIAKTYSQKPSKVKYMIKYGIAPEIKK